MVGRGLTSWWVSRATIPARLAPCAGDPSASSRPRRRRRSRSCGAPELARPTSSPRRGSRASIANRSSLFSPTPQQTQSPARARVFACARACLSPINARSRYQQSRSLSRLPTTSKVSSLSLATSSASVAVSFSSQCFRQPDHFFEPDPGPTAGSGLHKPPIGGSSSLSTLCADSTLPA